MKHEQNTSECLICQKPTKGGSRGLCQVHYRRFLAKQRAFETEEEASAFEEKCIAGGWLRPIQKGGRPKLDDLDPFDEIANSIRKASELDTPPSSDDVPDQTVGRRKKATRKKPSAPSSANESQTSKKKTG